MQRKVNRKWTNKKTGEVRSKTYTYKNRKGYTLVDKKGRVKRKTVQAFKDAIDANEDYSESEKRMLKEDLDDRIRTRKGKINKALTTTGFMGMQENNDIRRLFVNAGLSAEEAAEEYNIDINDLLNPDNWEDDTLTIGKGKKKRVFNFTFNYYNGVLEEK